MQSAAPPPFARSYGSRLDALIGELLIALAASTDERQRMIQTAWLTGFIEGARFGMGAISDADEHIEAEIRRRFGQLAARGG
jgi:hypothetical protein